MTEALNYSAFTLITLRVHRTRWNFDCPSSVTRSVDEVRASKDEIISITNLFFQLNHCSSEHFWTFIKTVYLNNRNIVYNISCIADNAFCHTALSVLSYHFKKHSSDCSIVYLQYYYRRWQCLRSHILSALFFFLFFLRNTRESFLQL